MNRIVFATCLCLAALVGIALIGPDATATEVAGCSAPDLGAANCYADAGDCATYSSGCDAPAAAAHTARPRLFGRWHARKAARHASYAAGSACVNGVCYPN